MGFITERDLRSAVAAATAAPSVHNTQPWLFRLGSETVHVYPDARRQLPIADPAGREMHISIGAAVFNLRVAIAALGWQPRVTLFPDPRDRAHVATVQAGEPRRPDESDSAMYDAIPRRHTNRLPYSDVPPSQAGLARLAEAARAERSELHLVPPDEKGVLLGVIRSADARQRRDPAYREELARWRTEDPARQDGVPAAAFGPLEAVDVLPVRDFGLGEPGSQRVVAQFEARPTLAVLTTYGDTSRDWLVAGQALQHVLLVATGCGLATSFMTQPLEAAPVRALIDADSPVRATQMILRIGYAPAVLAVPRRPVDEVLHGAL